MKSGVDPPSTARDSRDQDTIFVIAILADFLFDRQKTEKDRPELDLRSLESMPMLLSGNWVVKTSTRNHTETNVCIAAINGKPESVRTRLRKAIVDGATAFVLRAVNRCL